MAAEFEKAIQDAYERSGQLLARRQLHPVLEVPPVDTHQDQSLAVREQLSLTERPRGDSLPNFVGITMEQVAFHPDQITENTKVFIGPLVYYGADGKIFRIFDKLKDIKNIYTTFPEGRLERLELQIGGKSSRELMKKIAPLFEALNRLENTDLRYPTFGTLKEATTITTIKLKVKDLGLTETPTFIEINARAQELGLELCRPEVAAYKRLDDYTQPLGTLYYIGMDLITYMSSMYFSLSAEKADDYWEAPMYRVNCVTDIFFLNDPENEYLFCLPQGVTK